MAGKTLALFDVDGTLTPPRQGVTPEVLSALEALRAKGVHVAIVGGSDLVKVTEQLGEGLLQYPFVDYVFTENGLLAHKHGQEFHRENLKARFGEATYQAFVKSALRLIADQDIPVMTGTFIEYRNGMVNISPLGRNASQAERDAFEAYDREHKVRQKMIETLTATWGQKLDLRYSIGGQISFDVFPMGWDKTYCLRFLEDYDTIHFFGDKTFPGGNDYEIFTSERTIGHSVTTPADTIRLLNELFP